MQRVCVKFCRGKLLPRETFETLKLASAENSLSRTQWYKHFKSDGTSTEDDPGTGWSSMSLDDDILYEKVSENSSIICENRRLTAREVSKGRNAAQKKRSEDYRETMLHHDNALLTNRSLAMSFLASTLIVPQPPYSPGLAPTNFFLFPKLKSNLKGCRFQTTEKIEENSTRRLHGAYTRRLTKHVLEYIPEKR